MPRYPYVLFDLDGTLADTGEGVMNCAKHACKTLGYPEPPQSELDKIIGPSLGYSFPNYLGVKKEDTLDAIRIFRERYAVEGLLESEIYPGIADLLSHLKAAGCRLFVATCKPTAYSETILKNLGVADKFDLIVGSNLDNTRTEKIEVLDYLCKTAGIEPERCVMIGDRYSDVRGAKAFAMGSIGVTFGYGTREELEAEAATFIADSPADIENFILD
ncbi:MAG: HAD hydrolase-like protein [Clostridia bacterium]|nr:HAD hydrolase-like protein [Clostridia bacterium]